MRAINLEDILKNLGWEDGFQIPVANAENQALEEEVARLTLRKINAKYAYEDAVTKCDGLHNHLKHLQQESDLNQKLISAHKQQYTAEENSYIIAKAKKEGVEADTKATIKTIEETKKRHELQKAELAKGTAKLEKLKTEIQWDEEALKAWEESLKRRIDDNEALEKFSKDDERKYNELEARRLSLQVEHVTRTATIKKMVGDITEYERIIEKAGKTLRQQVGERDALINHWKDAVKSLHQRDTNVELYERQILEAHEVLYKQNELLEEQNNFLDNEKNNNARLLMEIEDINVLCSRIRRQHNEMIQEVATISSEVDTYKRMTATVANSLEKHRLQVKQLVDDIKQKDYKLKNYDEELRELQNKLEEIELSALTNTDKLHYLEGLMNFEEHHREVLIRDHEKMQGILYRARILLGEQLDKRKLREAEVASSHTAINKLTKFNIEALHELQKKKEVVYDMDLRIDQLESRISKMERSVIDDETLEMKNKICSLEAMFKEHEEVRSLLQDQINHIEQDMGKLSMLIAQDNTHLTYLQDKLQNERMLYEGGQKIVAAAKLRSQEKQVEENIIRLRVNQFDRAMKKEEENIYTLRKFRLTLDQLMRERLLEISTNKEILLATKRNSDEDKSRLKCDIMARKIRIDQFQKKYHSALMLLGKDEEGQPLSLTHLKLKAAQEKMMLQQEGDELDAKIRKAEKEIIAMENTLKVVNLTNSKFKRSLGLVDEHGEEATELINLQKQFQEFNRSIQSHKEEWETKENELEATVAKLEEIKSKSDEIKNEFLELDNQLSQIQIKDSEIGEKLLRTECHLRKVIKKLKDRDLSKYERDFEIRQLQDANKAVLARLTQMRNIYTELAPLVRRYATEYSVKLPDKSYVSSESSTLSRSTACHSTSSQESVRSERSNPRSNNSTSSKLSTVNLCLDINGK